MSIEKLYLNKSYVLHMYKNQGFDALMHRLRKVDLLIIIDDDLDCFLDLSTSVDNIKLIKRQLLKLTLKNKIKEIYLYIIKLERSCIAWTSKILSLLK